MDVVFQSTLPASYQEALESLVYFNDRQAAAQDAIIQALDVYGGLEIDSGPAGLRVTVGRRADAQCLFALIDRKGDLDLAGGLIYLRTSPEDLVVLHIAVADRYSQRRRTGLRVVMQLVRAVRAIAHRLRGVSRVTVLYRQDRHFQIPIKSDESAGPRHPASFEDRIALAS